LNSNLITKNTTSHVKLNELRCTNCGALIAKVSLQQGVIEVKCKCGTMNTAVADNLIKKPEMPADRVGGHR